MTTTTPSGVTALDIVRAEYAKYKAIADDTTLDERVRTPAGYCANVLALAADKIGAALSSTESPSR